VRERLANNKAGSGPWCLARAKALSVGLSNAYSRSFGHPSLFEECCVTNRTAVYGPVRTVVWQGSVGERRTYADQTA
jgi:hypothetical protein